MVLETALAQLRAVEAPASVRRGVLRRTGLADEYFRLPTSSIGEAYVAYNERGISAVNVAASPEAFEDRFRADFGRAVVPADTPPANLERTVREWLAGDRRHQLHFDLRGLTDFERAVLLKALEIPYGQMRPYGWIAREIGHPKAVRAVGTALAHNPIPLLIPCHRVVRSDGQLGHYSLIADDTKRVVLASEGLEVDRLVALAKAGTRYFGSDTTHIFCFPTCRYGKRMQPRHLVMFNSEAQARAAGYRPCKVCRPAA